MKKILLFMMLFIMAFSSCCKEEVEIAPSVNYKVGIFHDATLNKKNISLEFQISSGIIEKVIFESLWAFDVKGNLLYVELHENDFEWSRSNNGNFYKGICKTSLGELLATPNVIHKRTTLKGKAKINGKWIKI
mgnify:CR=1 FL=1